MDKDKDNIKYLLAYQRKALRILKIGLEEASVVHLLKERPQQKK